MTYLPSDLQRNKSYTYVKSESTNGVTKKRVRYLEQKKKCKNSKYNFLFQHETLSKNAQGQLVSIRQKLKESGRANVILILISVFFVGLNVPYIITWCSFYIPYKRDQFNQDQNALYFRYSFVHLAEILHMTNFAINLFLYCLASKAFRNRFRSMIFVLNIFKR